MKTPFRILLIGAVVGVLSSCGYQLGSAKPALLRNVTKLAIPTFKNKTLEPRIEVLLADSTVKAFQQDGTYEIVSDDRADAILYCTLDSIERRQARAVLNNVLATREFTLKLELKYELVDRVTGVALQRDTITGDTSFFINNDLQTDERQAIITAINELAQKLVGRIAEGF